MQAKYITRFVVRRLSSFMLSLMPWRHVHIRLGFDIALFTFFDVDCGQIVHIVRSRYLGLRVFTLDVVAVVYEGLRLFPNIKTYLIFLNSHDIYW